MKLRYEGPSDQENREVGRQNPDKGGLLQPGETYEVSGEAAKELLASDSWSKVKRAPRKRKPNKAAAPKAPAEPEAEAVTTSG